MKFFALSRIATYSILLLYLCTQCVDTEEVQKDIRSRYTNVLNVTYTPSGQLRHINGTFTDQGSWIGFTLPDPTEWINGFCGPYSLEYRHWLAYAAVNVGLQPEYITLFTPDSIQYIPGELILSAHTARTVIEQRLVFVDAQTALLRVSSATQTHLFFSGIGWATGTSIQVNNNTVTASHPSGENLCIHFAHDVQVKAVTDNYQADCELSGETYVVISYYQNEREKLAGIQKANLILSEPQSYRNHTYERWNNYLNRVLRSDMPADYNRIAVKTIMTLMSNRKEHNGGLHHEGVVPSHAVSYFMGFWAWDSWKHAVALSRIDSELAKNQIRAMFDYQISDGMIVDCIYPNSEENNARDSKPPLATWAVDAVFTATADTAFVREMYPQLLLYYRWWYAKRDHNRNGICEFGSVDGTLEAAAWESGMDNAIRFDKAQMVQNGVDAWSIDQESVDLNAFLAQEYCLLKKLAGYIGQTFTEPDHSTQVANYFFDAERGYFFDRRLRDGSFVRVEGCEGYAPLWTGIASKEQAARALKLLTDTAKFMTYIPFPTVAADDPGFMAKGYWRGPIWLDQTYFAIHGLRNYGYTALADSCTRIVFDRLQGLKDDTPIHENYGTHTGEVLKAPHFSWSAAHLLLLYEEYGKNKATILKPK